MQTPAWTVSLRLLIALVAATWLGPVLFWTIAGAGAAGQPENQVILKEPADSYYSMRDHRCYALVYTDTVSVSHNLELPPVKLSLATDRQQHSISMDLPAGQTTPVTLQPGQQTLVAEDSAGRRASLGVLYLLDALPNPPLTRTLVVSMSDAGASVTYAVEVPIEDIPGDFDLLNAKKVRLGLFIKRAFYPDAPSDTDLAYCRRLATNPTAFTGGELSTIRPPDVSVADGTMRATLKASVSGWRYDPPNTARRLLGVSPTTDGLTRVTFLYDEGNVRSPTPFPTSWDGHEMVWVNPATLISLEYDSNPPPAATADARNLPRTLINRLRPVLDELSRYHFFFALLTTLAAPLLPLIWLWRLRRRELADFWPRLVPPLRLGVLMWLGPLGAMILSLIVCGGSLSHASAALWVAVWGNGLAVILLSSPQTAPRPMARVTAWWGQRRLPGWTAWLGSSLLVAGLVGLSLALLANLNLLWRHSLTLPLEGLLLALVSWSLVSVLTRSEGSDEGNGNEHWLTIPRVAWIAWAVLLVLLAVPLPDAVYLFDPLTGWPMEIGRSLFLVWGICTMPYLGLMGSLVVFKDHSSKRPPPSGLSQLVFVFLVGFTGAFPVVPGESEAVVLLLSPVPFILSWLLFRVIARPAPTADAGSYKSLSYTITSDDATRDVVLAFGPQERDWDNGALGARYGLVLGGVLASLYGILLLPGVADQLNTPFLPLMVLVVFVLPIFLRWVLAGFFLGYFFVRLPGRSGAIKGLSLACAVATSIFAYDLVLRVQSGADLQVFFATDVVLTVLGLMGVGAMFDYRTIRQAGYTWQQLLALYRMPCLVGYTSTLLAAVSSTVVGLINGRITALVTNLVNAILRAPTP